MRLSRRLLHRLLLVGLALSLQVCGGGGKSTPADPGPVPAPTPTPTPEPVADPPLSASCAKLGPGVPDGEARCTTEAPDFRGQLQEAIEIVKTEHPEIFDGNNVRNAGAYIVELIRVMDRRDLCAAFDGEEIGVKANDSYSEHYDVLTSRSQVRNAFYIGTCYPAVFPLPQPPLPPPPASCPLPSSREVACGREEHGRYYWDVEDSIDELYAERPGLFDFNDWAPGQGHPRLTNPKAYHDAMVDKLVSKGYCAKFDGEEIQVKLKNEVSEHYDVNYQDAFVRRGEGIYRGSCYPAAF